MSQVNIFEKKMHSLNYVTLLFNDSVLVLIYHNTAAVYLLKISNENTRTMQEFCSKLTVKTEQSQ